MMQNYSKILSLGTVDGTLSCVETFLRRVDASDQTDRVVKKRGIISAFFGLKKDMP